MDRSLAKEWSLLCASPFFFRRCHSTLYTSTNLSDLFHSVLSASHRPRTRLYVLRLDMWTVPAKSVCVRIILIVRLIHLTEHHAATSSRLITRNRAKTLLSSLGPSHVVKSILRQIPPVQGVYHNSASSTARTNECDHVGIRSEEFGRKMT